MIDSTPAASGAVVDEGTARSPQPVVEADAGRQAEEAREDALAQARHRARSLALEGEQVPAGPEDRLDALADRRKVRAWARFILTRRARHGDAEIGGADSEPAAGVALVADEQLTAAAGAALEQLEADLAFVTDGMGQLERPRGAAGGGQQMQAKAREVARAGGAVAVVSRLGQDRALDGLAAGRAGHRR